jgi:RND family efflux transporter MFP subunit
MIESKRSRRALFRALATRLFVVGLSVATFSGVGCGDSNASHAPGDAGSGAETVATRLRVRTEPVREGRLEGMGRVTGTVRAFHRATITAETQGRVVARRVEPGARVEAGDLLVELEASRFELELARAAASLQAARTVLKHAEREFARGERLVAESAISEQRRDDLRHAVDRGRDEVALARVARDTAKRNLADTRILAPFAGRVDALAVDAGDFVAPGTPVATVVDLTRVRIFGGVTARGWRRVRRRGSAARISEGCASRRSCGASREFRTRPTAPTRSSSGWRIPASGCVMASSPRSICPM